MNDRDIEDTRQPPDEPEAVFCDDCGEEMEETWKWYQGKGMTLENLHCNNPFCPSQHEGIAKEMAELIVEQKDDIRRMKHRIKHFENS